MAVEPGTKIVECQLCPKLCRIGHAQRGDCRVRINIEGKLHAVTYGRPCSIHVDPVEKKPLNHFLPGSKILSIATAGCNLHCRNCQNWEISQANPEVLPAYRADPDLLVAAAIRERCPSIAYTYTDPVIYYEYAREASELAHENGLRNVLVTAAYINREPLMKLCSVVDAANVDLKFFNDDLYRSNCDGSLQPVLDALITMKEMGVWVEITNLIIPTLNDDPQEIREMCRWIRDNLGEGVPIHFSRFHPRYQLKNLPPTPVRTLIAAKEIAEDVGMNFIYIGNVIGQGESTLCPSCGEELIERRGYWIKTNRIRDGKCPGCDETIPGVWK